MLVLSGKYRTMIQLLLDDMEKTCLIRIKQMSIKTVRRSEFYADDTSKEMNTQE